MNILALLFLHSALLGLGSVGRNMRSKELVGVGVYACLEAMTSSVREGQ